MIPDLPPLGPVVIHSYGLFAALGLTLALALAFKQGQAQGVSPRQVTVMALVMVLPAILGSRLMYVAIHYAYYTSRPSDILKVWQGGLVFSGGLIAVVGVMIWYLRRRRLPFWKMGDLWAPGVALGQAVGRIGCFMAGCCYGQPTDLAWGVVFTNLRSLAPLHVPLHPTQLYAALSGFMIFAVLLLLNAKKKFEGQVFLWFLILHSTARLVIERFRGDDRGMIPGSEMSVTQLAATLLLLGAVALLVHKAGRRTPSSSP